MNLIKWKPMNDVARSREWMSSLFDDDFFAPFFSRTGLESGQWYPKVDVYESDEQYVVDAELPGMKRDDISIDLKGNVLTLSGRRSDEKESRENGYYRRERSTGQFTRAFTLPEGVDPEAVKAEYKDGVLKVMVPKPEKSRTRRITVQ